MLTQYEIRKRVEAIRASTIKPFSKVRLLLKMRRSLGSHAHSLEVAKDQVALGADPQVRAGMDRMIDQVGMLEEDIRDEARVALAKAYERSGRPDLS